MTPLGVCSARGEAAVLVAGHQRPTEVGSDQPVGPADVEGGARPVEHHAQQLGVAREVLEV